MTPIENPFTDFDRLVDEASEPLPPVRVVDFHCELTSEKNAFGIYLDGRASAGCRTHTHVPTADERIMPRGTAYQSDLGMCGPVHSVIGFDPATVIPRFLNGLPTRFEVGTGPIVFNACQIDVDPDTGERSRSSGSSASSRSSVPFDRTAAGRRAIADSSAARFAGRIPAAVMTSKPTPGFSATAPRPNRATQGEPVIPPYPSRVDLHTHSCRSDGVLEPLELVTAAATAGVQVLALSDHDTSPAFAS